MTVKITPLDGQPDNWDACIASYDTKTLFHESAWLRHILSIHPRAFVQYFAIEQDGARAGYLSAISLRKAFLRVWGAPLPGTGTNFLGPLVNQSVDQPELIRALIRACREKRVAHLELAHPWLDGAVMERSGFEVHHDTTHVVPLPRAEDAAWKQLQSTCRNRIRKAEANGLIAEVTHDPAFVDHFFAQYREVWAKQGMDTPFGIDRVHSLWNHLLPAGRLMPVWVRRDDEILATGLFPFDERCIYFWGAASWLKHQQLNPNELLHWTVMRNAIERGIPVYNMCGGKSQFKSKFGGEDVPNDRYSKSFLALLPKARRLYNSLHWAGMRLRGRVKGLTAPAPVAAA